MHKRITTIVLIVPVLLSFPIIYFMWKTDNTCDAKIIMKDGTEYSAMIVSNRENGITWLKKCDGTETSFPTVDIKTIEKINQ